MERRFTQSQVQLRKSDTEGAPSGMRGTAPVFFDGTPETEFELWPGVFERTMPTAADGVLSRGDDVRGLKNHDRNLLLGRTASGTMTLSKTSRGIVFDVPALPDTTTGRDTAVELASGDLSGSSHSFTVARETWTREKRGDDDVEIREIHEFGSMFDVGPVTFPAYAGADAGVRMESDSTEARSSYEAWKQDTKPRTTSAREAHIRILEIETSQS